MHKQNPTKVNELHTHTYVSDMDSSSIFHDGITRQKIKDWITGTKRKIKRRNTVAITAETT